MKFHYKHIAAGLTAAVMAGLSVQAAAADIQERRVKFSYPVSRTNPVGMATEKFIELVGQKTNGKIKVTGYADAQLGNEIQAMSSAQGGIIEMTVVSIRDTLIAWYERRGYRRTGEVRPFPYDDARFGIPRRDDLAFVVLEKRFAP